ncbi:MAG: DUF167 domain-containing protein [Gammaproteobacteria bacterium]
MKPNARNSVLDRSEDGAWQARPETPPVDGRANAELIRLVAKHYGCPRSTGQVRTPEG